jgi:uncharacterized protein
MWLGHFHPKHPILSISGWFLFRGSLFVTINPSTLGASIMGKIILLVLGVWLLVVLLRQYRRGVDASGKALTAPEHMVRCAVCGVHLPKTESIMKKGTYYCCEEHSIKAGQ